MKRFITHNYFCSNCFKTYSEKYDNKLNKIITELIPEKCVKCQFKNSIKII